MHVHKARVELEPDAGYSYGIDVRSYCLGNHELEKVSHVLMSPNLPLISFSHH